MKTFDVFVIFSIVTLFQLAASLEELCGEAQVIQVSDETRNVSKFHFPWAGALYSIVNKTVTGHAKYICGATLLSKSFSVTAGHCIEEKQSDGYRRLPSHIVVYFGIYDLRQKNATGSEIQEILLHADWNPFNEHYDADIALLKLRNSVTFTSIISPICLWPTDDEIVKGTVISWTEPEEDDPGYWNYVHDPLHNYPRRFTMPIRSSAECFLMQPRFKTIASDRTFCAGGLNSGQCLEVGNSGASMAVQTKGKLFLRGIVSASFIDIAGCDNVTFTLFTDVIKYKTWIIENVKEL